MRDEINIRLKEVYEYIRVHYNVLLTFCAPLIIVYYILRTMLIEPTVPFGLDASLFAGFFMDILYNIILTTVVIYIINSLNNNQNINFDNLKGFFRKNIVLIASAMLLILLFTYVGLMLLIIPGIIVFTRLAAVPFLITFDNVKLMNAFKLSFEYSKRYTWPMFFCLVIISFVALNLSAILGFLGLKPYGLIGTFIFSLTYVIDTILIYHFYLDIRSVMIADYHKIHSLNPPASS